MRPFDANGAFAPSVPASGRALRRLTARGAGATILSGVVGVAIQIVAAVTLGRLLTPRDFGLVTMVTTVSLLLMNVAGNGFTDALIQRRYIDHQLAGNLFWVNLAIGAVFALGFALSGTLLARFFGESAVAPIAASLSTAIVLTNASWVHLALAKRAMNFASVARNDMIARAVGVAVSIVFGLAGWGYWALVAGAWALALSTLAGAFLVCRWMPAPPRWAPGTGALLRFMVHISGRYTVNYFARNIDNVLVGWRFGAHALGFYKKAYDLFALSASQLVLQTSNVAVSALSRVKDERTRYVRNLLAAIAVMAFLGMGIAGVLTLAGPDVIRILLGSRWDEAGRIFTFFAPGIGIMMVYGTHGWIHVSIGRADRWFLWGIVEWTVTLLLFLVCLRWGAAGIAFAWCVSYWILVVPAMWYAGRPIGLGVRSVLSVVWRYIAASLTAGAATSAFLRLFPQFMLERGLAASAARLGAISICFAFLYLGAIVLLHGGTAPLRKMVRLLREMLPARVKSAPAVSPVLEEAASL